MMVMLTIHTITEWSILGRRWVVASLVLAILVSPSAVTPCVVVVDGTGADTVVGAVTSVAVVVVVVVGSVGVVTVVVVVEPAVKERCGNIRFVH